MKRKWGVILTAASLIVIVYAPVSHAVPVAQATAQSTDAKAELKNRIDARRTSQNVRLSNAENARVKGTCIAAQVKIDAISKKINENNQPFVTRYESYIKRLNEVGQKHSSTELSNEITSLNQKYQAYKTAVDQLNLSLSDLKSVDCKSDPVGFVATLREARTQLQTVQTARKELNAYPKDTIAKTLQDMKKGSR